MKCAEQVRKVYVQVQMWKAIYSYMISTLVSSPMLPGLTGISLAEMEFPFDLFYPLALSLYLVRPAPRFGIQ